MPRRGGTDADQAGSDACRRLLDAYAGMHGVTIGRSWPASGLLQRSTFIPSALSANLEAGSPTVRESRMRSAVGGHPGRYAGGESPNGQASVRIAPGSLAPQKAQSGPPPP